MSLAQPGLRESPIRFDWRGPAALALVVLTLAVTRFDLAYGEWRSMFGNQGFDPARVDWLLAAMGVFFLWCTTYDVNPRLDLATVAAGFVGGTVIEIWGTRTGLWHYYTWEKPPLWILPAWSMSALANERILRFFLERLPAESKEKIVSDEAGTPLWRAVHRGVSIPLIAFYLWWARPRLFDPYTVVTGALLISSFVNPRFPRYALALLGSGVLLGVFLEIWGTTRHCWNYYDFKTPSPFPIFGHGMAAVSFWKLKEMARGTVASLSARRGAARS